MKDKIKQQLDQLNDRERNMVYAALIALVIFVPYQFIWVPLADAVDQKQTRVEKQQRDLIWMQSKVDEVKRLSHLGQRNTGSAQSVYGVVERTARQKFKSGIRVQQEGKRGIRVKIENTGFDDIMNWLDVLSHRHRVIIKELKVDTGKDSGRVQATILLEG